MKWVTVKKLSEMSGYTDDAIRAKKQKGVWLIDKHWTKAPDNKVLFNPKAIDDWVEGN